MSGGRAVAKRTVDIGVGLVLAVLVLPTILLLAAGVAISMRCNPFFVQERVGRNGRTFRCVKIRTLSPSTPREASKYELIDLDDLPKICQLIRRTHLDELPQLFLVVWGTMSLVGPRPEMHRLHDQMDATFARERVSVPPGCTGLWQISTDSQRLISEVPGYDLLYIREGNLRMDLWILWRTLLLVATGNSVEVSAIPEWARRRTQVPKAPAVRQPVTENV